MASHRASVCVFAPETFKVCHCAALRKLNQHVVHEAKAPFFWTHFHVPLGLKLGSSLCFWFVRRLPHCHYRAQEHQESTEFWSFTFRGIMPSDMKDVHDKL